MGLQNLSAAGCREDAVSVQSVCSEGVVLASALRTPPAKSRGAQARNHGSPGGDMHPRASEAFHCRLLLQCSRCWLLSTRGMPC